MFAPPSSKSTATRAYGPIRPRFLNQSKVQSPKPKVVLNQTLDFGLWTLDLEMRILHIIQRYYPYVGGSELYFQELSERLARAGHRVEVWTTDAWDLDYFWSKKARRVGEARDTHNGVTIR